MPSAPRPDTNLARRAGILAVYLTDRDGSITDEDEQPHLSAELIRHGVGREVECRIAYNSASYRNRIGDESLDWPMESRVEVWMVRREQGRSGRIETTREFALFAGLITSHELAMTENQEHRYFVATVPDEWFGELIEGPLVYSYLDAAEVVHASDLEFNPKVDGLVVANMVAPGQARNPLSIPIWVDPESVRSQTAIDNYHGTPSAWTIRGAIRALCGIANSGEDNLANPSLENIDQATSNASEIKNISLPRGRRLDEYLSGLLPRYGVNWCVDFAVSEDESFQPRIRIYELGRGPVSNLRIGRFNSTTSFASFNVDQIQISADIRDVTTHLVVTGARREREVTVELYRGWPTSEDATVAVSSVDQRAGRKWIANEGGDYTDLRPEINDPIELFGEGPVPRRRVIEHCLTYLEGTEVRRPPVIEYSTDDGGNWSIVDGSDPENPGLGLRPSILPTEIGIWFTDEELPSELLETNPENLRLRITGTVRDDTALKFETLDGDNQSMLAGTVTRHIDASDQFYDRRRQSTGDAASVLTGEHDNRDDQSELEEYARTLLSQMDAMQLVARISIPWLATGYKIGDIVEKVEGREINLRRSWGVDGTGDRMQIVGLEYFNSNGQQRTELITQPFDI
ncbi:hypothetical protein KOR42_39250 [Thalassoglobus neptunius]|uniref:Uncharacterized protein n=1 Tax=Thalassoglobus neptunius TaxID=1938619 RepID=A0A5C5WFZ0_9PLAN|nr:hypothetical protein [Thalassoglobus neptunius]TWT49009.1 hypothetical protein KOR42_39250 [Thalassoglobus neptunius]